METWTGALKKHETSKQHLEAVVIFTKKGRNVGFTDQDLEKQRSDAIVYWREVLKRVISTSKFIAERGLAFRGDDELIGSERNGNDLGILGLIAEFDQFLSNHIKNHGNLGKGHVNYLSSTICEELIELKSEQVLKEIISKIKTSKYYLTIPLMRDSSLVDFLVHCDVLF